MTFPTYTAVAVGLRALGVASTDKWAPLIGDACAAQGINTLGRLAPFLSTVSHETGKLKSLVEGLNYSVDGLLKTFGRHRISERDARALGRQPWEKPLSLERQAAIANLVYGGPWGLKNLGNTRLTDGWYFRGKGGIQLTGRANHTRFAKILGITVVELQPLLETPETAMESAAEFWRKVGCNELADDGDIPELRRRVNGGALGLLEITQGAERVQTALRAGVA